MTTSLEAPGAEGQGSCKVEHGPGLVPLDPLTGRFAVATKYGMRIVFDALKRRANLKKHGLDMADFEEDFDGAVRTPDRPSRTGRARFGLVGWLRNELVVVSIVSPLGSEALSLVRLHPASMKERDLYGFR